MPGLAGALAVAAGGRRQGRGGAGGRRALDTAGVEPAGAGAVAHPIGAARRGALIVALVESNTNERSTGHRIALNQCDDQGAAGARPTGRGASAGACRLYASGVDAGGHLRRLDPDAGRPLRRQGRLQGRHARVLRALRLRHERKVQDLLRRRRGLRRRQQLRRRLCGKKPLGTDCAAAADCESGFGAQGKCCDSGCSTTCKSCAIAGSEGTCSFVPSGADPLYEPVRRSDRGHLRPERLRDGAGACQKYPSAPRARPPAARGIP